MNKNEDNFKNAFDKIHPSEKIVNDTIEKATKKKENKIFYLVPVLATCAAAFVLVFTVGFNNNVEQKPDLTVGKTNTVENPVVKEEIKAKAKDNIVRFASADELKDKIDELRKLDSSRDMVFNAVEEFSAMTDSAADSVAKTSTAGARESTANYSKTNVQVEGVDEADIIKTDGENIYIVSSDKIIVLDKDLNLVDEKSFGDEKTSVYVQELFITSDKIVLIGQKNEIVNHRRNYAYYTDTRGFTNVIVLDKDTLEVTRTVGVTGRPVNSRLIGNNLYFITNEGSYLYNYYAVNEDEDQEEIEYFTPKYEDSVIGDEEVELAYSDIAYIKGCKSAAYTNVCSFNITEENELNVESIFGAGTNIYCSQNNLYLVNSNYMYSYDSNQIQIFKFRLNNGTTEVLGMAELKGTINDQFSLDEYDGYLRVATTEYKYNRFSGKERMINHMFVLDEGMEVVGQTEDYAKGERIYAVRFVGKVGYVVTFEQVDPLFVMDLSDPTNPVIKGELEIPGYSSYLHPYDETHIIGIGSNVEPNGYGGVHNTNMKMSMFDVSDLENPKEVFSIDIGEGDYVYSEIQYNHKALLYDEERELIGFPISDDDGSGFVIYKINDDGFELLSSKHKDERYFDAIRRIIYIDDTVYALGYDEITSYDLYTMEDKDRYEIQEEPYGYYYYDDVIAY